MQRRSDLDRREGVGWRSESPPSQWFTKEDRPCTSSHVTKVTTTPTMRQQHGAHHLAPCCCRIVGVVVTLVTWELVHGRSSLVNHCEGGLSLRQPTPSLRSRSDRRCMATACYRSGTAPPLPSYRSEQVSEGETPPCPSSRHRQGVVPSNRLRGPTRDIRPG